MVIVEDGEPCQGACTGRGHVESYCSGSAVDRLAQRVLGPDASAHDLVDAAAIRRSPRSDGIWAPRSARVVNLFGPEVVVVGGGFGVAAFELLRRARARSDRPRGACRRRHEVPIVAARSSAWTRG